MTTKEFIPFDSIQHNNECKWQSMIDDCPFQIHCELPNNFLVWNANGDKRWIESVILKIYQINNVLVISYFSRKRKGSDFSLPFLQLRGISKGMWEILERKGRKVTRARLEGFLPLSPSLPPLFLFFFSLTMFMIQRFECVSWTESFSGQIHVI